MNDTTTKLLITAVAVGMYVLTHFFPDLAPLLVPVAAAMIGAMWIPTPGMMKTPPENTTTTITRAVVDNTPVIAVDVTPPPLPPESP